MTTIRHPQGNLLLRNLHWDYPVVRSGKGVYLYDLAGRQYLDAAGGAFVVSVGHGNRAVVARMARQLEEVSYLSGLVFTSEVAQELAERLARLAAPLGLSRAAFLTSGSEAVEAALKLARQLCVERGEGERVKLISRTPSYHGNTLFALSASGRPHYRSVFQPLLAPVLQVSAPYPYRCGLSNYELEGADYYAGELESLIEREDPRTIFAFLLETVGGSSTGASLPPPGYFQQIEEICRRHGILVIADEVLCGCGRTGRFFAAEHYAFRPDILVLGKGISGGYAPLSVVLVREEHVECLAAAGRSFLHAQTYMQAPCLAAAGLAVLDYFEKHSLLENCRSMGELLHGLLQEEVADLPGVGWVGGLGLLAGIELVQDKASREPFPRSRRVAEGLLRKALEKGLTLWPNVGSANGIDGDQVLIGPPLIISRKEVEELVRRLRETIRDFFGQ